MQPELAQSEISQERDRLRLLLKVNNAIASHLDLHDLLHAISQTLGDYIPHDFTALATYDDEIGKLRVHAIEGESRDVIVADGTPLPMEGTFAGVAYTKRQTILRDRIDFEEFHQPLLRPAVEALGLRSLCVVPLFHRDQIVGVVSLASRVEAAFSEDDARLMEQIGTQLAIAVANALNFRRAERERDRRRLLLEVSNAVVSNLTLRELLFAVSGWLRRFFEHDFASVVLLEPDTGLLRVHALDA